MLLPLHLLERRRRDGAHRELMAELFRELNQSERSASAHCVREAERLGDVGPAAVLRTIAVHAAQSINELPLLASTEGLPTGRLAQAVGSFFSLLRTTLLDRLMYEQMSYRGTLLGLRHGLDCARLLAYTAVENDCEDLATWCGEWMLVREPLVRVATEELAWFAQNPDRAIARATPLPAGRARPEQPLDLDDPLSRRPAAE